VVGVEQTTDGSPGSLVLPSLLNGVELRSGALVLLFMPNQGMIHINGLNALQMAW